MSIRRQACISLCLAGLAAAARPAAAQPATLLAEGFNGASLPTGWAAVTLSTGTGSGADPAITFETTSSNADAVPYEGTRMARFNSWFARSNAQLRLESPAFDASGPAVLAVQFAWHHDSRTDSRDQEGMQVQWSTNNGTTWHDVFPFHMRRGTPLQWGVKRIGLPPEAHSATLRIGFRFRSQYGNHCYLDDVRVLAVPPVADYPYAETFADGFGAWSAGAESDYPWTRHTGLTPSGAWVSQMTGPSNAHSGAHYVYAESSDPNFPGKTMILEAPFDFSSLYAPQLSFLTHLCGMHIGDLHAEVRLGDGMAWTPLWSVSGQQQTNEGDPWELQTVDLSAYGGQSGVRLRFRGVTGSGGLGDMALDTIAIEETLFVPHSARIAETGPEAAEHVLAGAPLSKSWTLRNEGNLSWSAGAGMQFAFGGGDRLASVSNLLFGAGETIAPGASREFAVTFTAPTNRGPQAGFWSLRRNGTNFGERVWLHVNVDTPDIAITGPLPPLVSDQTTAVTLQGTTDPSAVGHLRWTNALTGASGQIPADAAWEAVALPLGTGENLLTITATNLHGVSRRDSIFITRTPPGADTDSDGLPDWWEEAYFGAPTAASPDADDDEDGMSNLAEFIAGTHPRQAGSVLALEPLAVQSGVATNLVFQWPAVSGRVYSIWMATNLTTPHSRLVGEIPAATGSVNVHTSAAPAALGVYIYGIGVTWPDAP
jgi:hypothetical protein